MIGLEVMILLADNQHVTWPDAVVIIAFLALVAFAIWMTNK